MEQFRGVPGSGIFDWLDMNGHLGTGKRVRDRDFEAVRHLMGALHGEFPWDKEMEIDEVARSCPTGTERMINLTGFQLGFDRLPDGGDRIIGKRAIHQPIDRAAN